MCESFRPGMTVAPFRSITSLASFPPCGVIAVIRPSVIWIDPATVLFASSVRMLPLTKAKSAGPPRAASHCVRTSRASDRAGGQGSARGGALDDEVSPGESQPVTSDSCHSTLLPLSYAKV